MRNARRRRRKLSSKARNSNLAGTRTGFTPATTPTAGAGGGIGLGGGNDDVDGWDADNFFDDEISKPAAPSNDVSPLTSKKKSGAAGVGGMQIGSAPKQSWSPPPRVEAAPVAPAAPAAPLAPEVDSFGDEGWGDDDLDLGAPAGGGMTGGIGMTGSIGGANANNKKSFQFQPKSSSSTAGAPTFPATANANANRASSGVGGASSQMGSMPVSKPNTTSNKPATGGAAGAFSFPNSGAAAQAKKKASGASAAPVKLNDVKKEAEDDFWDEFG